jgi:hypothetical protein
MGCIVSCRGVVRRSVTVVVVRCCRVVAHVLTSGMELRVNADR